MTQGLPEPQFLHHCNGDPLALPLPLHTGGRNDHSAHLVKSDALEVIVILSRPPGSSGVVWDAGGGGCGSERGWVPGVEKARAFMNQSDEDS